MILCKVKIIGIEWHWAFRFVQMSDFHQKKPPAAFATGGFCVGEQGFHSAILEVKTSFRAPK